MSDMAPEDDFVRITLRIPARLHQQLTDAAAKKRSMNAEIISRLEGSFEQASGPDDAKSFQEVATDAAHKAAEAAVVTVLTLFGEMKALTGSSYEDMARSYINMSKNPPSEEDIKRIAERVRNK